MNKFDNFPFFKGLTRRSRRVIYILVTFLSVFVLSVSPAQGAASSQDPAPESPTVPSPWTWKIYPVDTPPMFYYMTDRSMRFRPDGAPCIAYGGDHLYYSCYSATSKTWSTTTVDNSIMVGAYAALAFNQDNNRPFISYFDGKNGRLKLAYKYGGAWVTKVIDAPTVAQALAPEPEPQPAAEVSEALADLFDKVDLRPWREPLVMPDFDMSAASYSPGAVGVGKHTSIAVDRFGRVHISYFDQVNGALKYAYWNTDIATDPIIVEVDDHAEPNDEVGLWTSITTDYWCQPYISYMDEQYDNLKMAHKHGDDPYGSWDVYTVDSDEHVGTFSSIALASNGIPYISYLDFGAYNLKIARLVVTSMESAQAELESAQAKYWESSVVDSSGYVGLYTSLNIDSDDRVQITYYDIGNGNLKLAYNAGGGGGWTISHLAAVGNVGLYTSIDTTDADLPGVSYYNQSLGALQYMGWDSHGHKAANTVDYDSDVGVATSLKMTNAGYPHISYLNDTRNLLKYARTNGLSWATAVLTTTISGWYSSIDLQANNLPLIAFYDGSNHDLAIARKLNATQWKFKRVDTTGDVGQFVSLAMDAEFDPHISYYDATAGDLMYAIGDLSDYTWDITAADTRPEDVGRFTSLDLFNNRPYISYFDVTRERVMLAYKTTLGAWEWSIVQIVGDPDDDEPIDEAYNSVAVDSAGIPHVAFYNQTDGELYFASRNGLTWDIVPLDTAASGAGADRDVGRFNSLAIGPDDARHLCYYDTTLGNLMYMYWDSVTSLWSDPQKVDVEGDVGLYCSIDVDALGRPGISYYDASMGDLMYASSFILGAMHYLPFVFTAP